MEKAFDQYEVWFVTGAQLLYGGDAVIAVDAHSNEMVNGLNESGKLPVKVVYKGTANSSKDNVSATDVQLHTGSSTVNIVPCRSSLSTCIVPPCISTKALTNASPIPDHA